MKYQQYRDVCLSGYQVLGRTNTSARNSDARRWQFSPGLPPSYSAMGRYRFLDTLHTARSVHSDALLEVAGGGGFLSACLYRPGNRVVINDLRDLRSSLANWTTGSEIQFIRGNILDFDPDRLGTFDLVIAAELIEHVAHGDQLLACLSKFVKPGGHLLLTTPNGAYFRSRLPTYSQLHAEDFKRLEADQFKPDADGHLYLYTASELRALCGNSGLADIRIAHSITPFISGHAGLSRFPIHERLIPLYYLLNKVATSTPFIKEKLCTQLTLTAQKPG